VEEGLKGFGWTESDSACRVRGSIWPSDDNVGTSLAPCLHTLPCMSPRLRQRRLVCGPRYHLLPPLGVWCRGVGRKRRSESPEVERGCASCASERAARGGGAANGRGVSCAHVRRRRYCLPSTPTSAKSGCTRCGARASRRRFAVKCGRWPLATASRWSRATAARHSTSLTLGS